MGFRIESYVGPDAKASPTVASRVAAMSAGRFGEEIPVGYFESLLQGHPACFAILTYQGATDVAFSSILPLREAIARRHRIGRLDEFELTEPDISDPRSSPVSEPVFLCVQAIALSRDVRALIHSLRPKRIEPFMSAFEAMIWQQLRDLGLSRPFEDVTLYSEVWSPEGLRQIEDCGQTPILDEVGLPVKTAQGYPMHARNSIKAVMASPDTQAWRYYLRFCEAMGRPFPERTPHNES